MRIKKSILKGYLYINKDKLGEVEFEIIDESMGAIGGELLTYDTYEVYRKEIQRLGEKKGIANVDDFDFKITFVNNHTIDSKGGIGVTECLGIDEIYVESAGNSQETLAMVKCH